MSKAIHAFRRKNEITLGAFGVPFGVNRSTVLRWQTLGVPAERVIEIEKYWGIPRHKLRPDLYPKESRTP